MELSIRSLNWVVIISLVHRVLEAPGIHLQGNLSRSRTCSTDQRHSPTPLPVLVDTKSPFEGLGLVQGSEGWRMVVFPRVVFWNGYTFPETPVAIFPVPIGNARAPRSLSLDVCDMLFSSSAQPLPPPPYLFYFSPSGVCRVRGLSLLLPSSFLTSLPPPSLCCLWCSVLSGACEPRYCMQTLPPG